VYGANEVNVHVALRLVSCGCTDGREIKIILENTLCLRWTVIYDKLCPPEIGCLKKFYSIVLNDLGNLTLIGDELLKL